MTHLAEHLSSLRSSGRKLLVPYVMAGWPSRSTWAEVVEAVAPHADAIEIGLPYSDPLMDGPVIAAAADRALTGGVGPIDVLSSIPKASIPRVAMTYYNPIHKVGERKFCELAAAAGLEGLIVPDIPVEESGSLRESADAVGLAWIPLVAPSSPPERVARTVASATGFVYAVSTLGVTGERASVSQRAEQVVHLIRDCTELPVLVGIGISTAQQAVEAASYSDGVVIGSAIVKVIGAAGPSAAGDFVASVRLALDAKSAV